MSHTPRFVSPGGILLAICAALAGCSSRTNVSATGSTPPQFQHVFITAEEVWFNTSATATPEDSGWAKFPLTTPVTVDLVTQSNGSLGELINDLHLTPGSYSQIRLIPVDASAALTTSAQALGAHFNAEADYVDSAGTAHQLALELPNPDKGIGVQASLSVPVGKVGASTLGTSSTTNSTTNQSTGLFGSTSNTTNNTTNTTTNSTTTTGTTTTGTSTSTGSSTNTTTTVSFAMSFDGSRDLAMFTYGAKSGVAGQSGVLLSAHPTAYDLASAGAISGTLTLTTLPTTATTNALTNRLNIEATAETLSADGTRHIVVANAPVSADGTFTLYPLSSNSSTPTTYDVVIHGPGIATMIIKSVPVTVTPPATTSSSTTATIGATTATTPVSIGAFIPRAAPASFSVNVTPTASATLPGGATVGFYQTLPASGEVPYVIEEAAVDPFNFTLGSDESLSAATIDSGTYTASGAAITLTSSTPTEGAGKYRVAATAPLFADGAISFNTTVAQPAPGTTTAVPVTVPALTFASGASATSITASVTQATARKYNQGEVIVTHEGAVIGTAPLDTALTGGGTVTINGLPGGSSGSSFSSALYYLSVRVWNSSDPSTVNRQWYASPVDLRSGSATGVSLTVN